MSVSINPLYFSRLLRTLGCSHGCPKSLRGPQAECLRVQAKNTLRELRSANIPKFSLRLKEMTKFAPIWDVIENLHATLGYCADPSTMVSPMSKYQSEFVQMLIDSSSAVGFIQC